MTETGRILKLMCNLINPAKARKINIVYSFRFSGEQGGDYSLSITEGKCAFETEIMPGAAIIFECEAKVWIAIAEGRIKPWQAILRKEMRFTGSFLALLRFKGLFSGDAVAEEVPGHLFKETDNERAFQAGIMSKANNILVLQSSPRSQRGATEIMVNALITGIEETGSTVDIKYLSDMEINHCTGCYYCWKHTEGICIHHDDMSVLLGKITEYDLVVIATPLYNDLMPGKLKVFFDRCLVLLHPYIFNKSGRCRHPSRHKKLPNIALLTVCGFYEKENFDNIIQWLEDSSENSHMPLVASLLRPHAHILLGETRFATIDNVLDATIQAGRELAQTGRVTKKTQREVSAQLVSKAIFMAAGKNWWETEEKNP